MSHVSLSCVIFSYAEGFKMTKRFIHKLRLEKHFILYWMKLIARKQIWILSGNKMGNKQITYKALFDSKSLQVSRTCNI